MAIKEQMELFEVGGLADEGGTTDPVSGNNVPVGSTQEEVRDDIPAQLSEGEFVLPADVVRYHGLEKIMELRDEAKAGLQKMEDMGQMGNSDEAVLDDDVPFSMDDLEIEDDGVAEYQVGGFVQSQFANYQPQYQQYQAPTVPTVPTYQAPQQAATPTMTGPAPDFGGFVLPKYVTYVDDKGNTIQVPVDPNGKPLIPVPAGYKKQEAAAQTPAAPETTPTDTAAQQQQTVQQQDDGDSGPTPEEMAREAERREMIANRKAVAKELGYTKEQSLGQGLLGLTPLGGLATPEVGTILGDGTIADGQGNSFDPITGKQVGFKGGIAGNVLGGLGLSKTEAEKFGLPEGSPIPESSIAGLGSKAGYESIANVLAEAGSSQERINELVPQLGGTYTIPADLDITKTAVTDVTERAPLEDPYDEPTVESTQVTKTGVNVAEAAKAENTTPAIENAMTALQAAINDGKLTGQQKANFLNDVIAQREGTTQGLATDAKAVTYTPEKDDDTAADFQIAAARILEQSRDDSPTVSTRPTATAKTAPITKVDDGFQRGPLTTRQAAQAQADAGAIRSGVPTRTQSFEDRDDYKGHVASYQSRGYSSSAAKSAAANKTRADDEAMRQTGDYSGNTSAVTDSKGNAVRSSSGSVVTSGSPPSNDDGDTSNEKIVCTEMYRQTQLADWTQAMKIWGTYEKKYLTPYHEIGYHWLFKPYVRGMQKSNILTKLGAYLAMERTKHLKHVMTKGRAKDSIVGNLWCKIIHPIVYVAGRIKNG